MYNKLFTKILDSSIWLAPTATRIVWLTFIAAMDEAGYAQFASVGNVAHRARVTLEEAQTAIAELEGPDADSSDPDNEGRRLERVPGGWMVINAKKHRDMVTRVLIREQTRLRVQKHREKRNGNAPVTPSDTETDTKAETKAKAEIREERRNPATSRSKRPVFSGQRVTVFEWMLTDCLGILADHAEAFDLHSWFFDLDAKAVRDGLVIPRDDRGAWLQAELVAEAQRRGLPLQFATPAAPSKKQAAMVRGARAFLEGGE